MDMKLNYNPSDLAYYTTWWLTSKPSISSQTMTSSSNRTSIKSMDEPLIHQRNIDQDEVQTYCCLPIKKFRRKQ